MTEVRFLVKSAMAEFKKKTIESGVCCVNIDDEELRNNLTSGWAPLGASKRVRASGCEPARARQRVREHSEFN